MCYQVGPDLKILTSLHGVTRKNKIRRPGVKRTPLGELIENDVLSINSPS